MDLLAALAPPLCAGCGAARRGEPLCGRCRRALTWLSPLPVRVEGLWAWAPVAYAGPARALVRALKFGGAWSAAEAMAAQIAANAPGELLAGEPVVVPVPLHARRRRSRGFDQAALLAGALATRAGLAAAFCLERGGSARTQVGRSRAERLAGPPGTVALSSGAAAPERVLLVDDVLTTGATFRACAEALRNAGTRTVTAVAYARTPGR